MNQSIQQLSRVHEKDKDMLDVSAYVDFIFDSRWLITIISLALTLLGTAYAFLSKPIFEASILVQVEESAAAPRNMLGDLTAAFDTRTQAATEAEVMRSRSVILPAVEKWRLYMSAEPKRFPLIGSLVARRNKNVSEPGLFGYGGYAWGAEQADVPVFNVPEELEGRMFTLTALGLDRFRLNEDELGIMLDGKIGEDLRVATRQGDIELRVERLAAKPGAQFLLVRTASLQAVERLQNALNISERGKQSGVIGVTLEGPDPQLTSAVLNEIGREYVRQNVDRKSEEAEKTLAFFSGQLPNVKRELESSEAKYNELRNSRGTIDLGEEARAALQQSAAVQTKLVEINQKKQELLTRFTANHPSIQVIDQQIRELNREVAGIDAKIRRRPAMEQDVFRLERDLKVNADVYTGLLSMTRQLRLIEANKVGNVRLLDAAAKPIKPVRPNRPAIILLAAVAGLVLGGMAAFAKKVVRGGINDPYKLEQYLGLQVCATIPHSEIQEKLHAYLQSGSNRVLLLPHDTPSDYVIESLRAFRTSLQFAMRDAKNNVVMITGPSASVGKSFISANFAAVLAATGKKVLLIDADMHLGHLHRYFGLEKKEGLSDAIAGKPLPGQVIHRNTVKGVDFISTGSFVSAPAELLAHANFGKLLQFLSPHYDLVLIDTPPVLAFADAMIVGSHAEVIFSVVRSGANGMGEVEESVKRLNQAGLTVAGIVFNDLNLHASRYGYRSRYGVAHPNISYQHRPKLPDAVTSIGGVST